MPNYANIVVVKGADRATRIEVVERALTILQTQYSHYKGSSSVVAASDPIPSLTPDENAIFAAGSIMDRAAISLKLCKTPHDVVLLCDWIDSDDLFNEQVSPLVMDACKGILSKQDLFDIDLTVAVADDGDDAIGSKPEYLAGILSYMVGVS